MNTYKSLAKRRTLTTFRIKSFHETTPVRPVGGTEFIRCSRESLRRRNGDQVRPEENRCAIITKITAPSVAAASEYRNPPPKRPSLIKIHPPSMEPTMPKIMSVKHPNPAPREILPASHPAMSPITIQPIKLLVS